MSEQYDDSRRKVKQELAERLKGVEAIIEASLPSQEQLDHLRTEVNASIDRASKRLEAISRDFEMAPRPAPSITRKR